jgi:hypothetical protein
VAGQTIKLYMFWSNLRGTCPSQRGLLLILTSGTKINSCDPPLTAVCTAYATPPFPLFSHPQSSRPAFDYVAIPAPPAAAGPCLALKRASARTCCQRPNDEGLGCLALR